MHSCECIGRDIGYGCRDELGMLWSGVGGRLGVDLCNLLGLAARSSASFLLSESQTTKLRRRVRVEGGAFLRVHW